MKISTTLLLAGLLAGLGVYYLNSERLPGQNPAAELNSIRILTVAEGDSVSWLQIQNRKTMETITLKKEGPRWFLKFPVSYPAENLLVKGMVSALTISPRLRRFPFKDKTLKEFGLEPPVIKISVETEKTPLRRSLLLGEASPVGAGIYARWVGEDETFLIPAEVKASFERTVYSLRQKKLFRVNWDDVTWIHIKLGTREYRIEKTERAWRTALPPNPVEIPLEKATDLIYAFQSLYVKDFLDGKDPAKTEFGLRVKKDFLAVGVKEGVGDKLILGARAEEKDSFYAVREKEKLLLLVSRPNVEKLFQNFEVTLQRVVRRHDSGKSPADSGKNSEGLPTGGPKSGGGAAGLGDQNRAARAPAGGV